jgi:hypothetical protein
MPHVPPVLATPPVAARPPVDEATDLAPESAPPSTPPAELEALADIADTERVCPEVADGTSL